MKYLGLFVFVFLFNTAIDFTAVLSVDADPVKEKYACEQLMVQANEHPILASIFFNGWYLGCSFKGMYR